MVIFGMVLRQLCQVVPSHAMLVVGYGQVVSQVLENQRESYQSTGGAPVGPAEACSEVAKTTAAHSCQQLGSELFACFIEAYYSPRWEDGNAYEATGPVEPLVPRK